MAKAYRSAILANMRTKADEKFVCPELIGKNDPLFVTWGTIVVPSQLTRVPDESTEIDIAIVRRSGEEMAGSLSAMRTSKELVGQVMRGLRETRGINSFTITSLIPSVTRGGIDLLEEIPAECSLTHGDSLASAIAREQAAIIARHYLGKPERQLTIALVGTGLIGSYLAPRFAQNFGRLILIARSMNKLGHFVKSSISTECQPKVSVGVDLGMIAEADIVVTATSSTATLLTREILASRGDKPLFILDVSVPPNVGPASWTEIEKTMPNVLRVDGSIVSIPDIDMNTVKIAGVAEGTIFSCWAEGMMHAGEREGQNHVGSIDPDYAKRVLRWMQRYAFQIAPPTNFGQIVPPNVFKRLRG